VLASDPDSEEALSNLSRCTWRRKIWIRFAEYFAAVAESCSAIAAALQGLATVALERQDHHACAPIAIDWVQLAPDCLEAWHNLRVCAGSNLSGFHCTPTCTQTGFHRLRR